MKDMETKKLFAFLIKVNEVATTEKVCFADNITMAIRLMEEQGYVVTDILKVIDITDRLINY